MNDFSTVKELVDYSARVFSDRIALAEGENEYSFPRLKSDVYALAAELLRRGRPGMHIAIRGINSYAWIRAYLAVMTAGCVVVPLPAGLPDGKTLEIAALADSELILSDTPIENSPVEVLPLDLEAAPADDAVLPEADPNDVAKIIFTSGTTGIMKGVPLTHANILCIARCEMLAHAGKISIAVLPFNHAFEAVCHLLTMLSFGSKLYICPSLRQFPALVASSGCDVLFLVPSLAEALLTRFRRFLDKAGNLNSIICGGAPIPAALGEAYASLGIALNSGYGLSECSPLVALNHDAVPGTCGRPLAYCRVRISDEGEIQVKGENVFGGYYKNEEATRAAFTDDGWLKTGDLGYLDETGQLFLTGRIKNLIILSNGENVSPEELENLVIDRVAGVSDALCFAGDDTLCLRVYAPEADEESLRKSISDLNSTLPPYQRMTGIEVVREPLPMNATGKKLR